jgi:hypothetical protein
MHFMTRQLRNQTAQYPDELERAGPNELPFESNRTRQLSWSKHQACEIAIPGQARWRMVIEDPNYTEITFEHHQMKIAESQA